MKKIFTSIVCLYGILLACNKKDHDPSKTELLMSGTWKITGIMSDNDGNGTYESNEYAGFPNCVKDNYFTFKAGSVLEMNESSEKCAPADPQTDNTTWQLTQNETKLVIDSEEYIIDLLNNSTLQIKEDVSAYGSMITFTKR